MTRQVLAVNVGHAGPMVVQGETIVTGFDKRPTDGAVRVEAYGLVGDDHVDDALDLDRAVLLYQRCHYDAWEAELGRELPPGTFGENLTVDWPADHEVGLGDELRIGDVRLRVTQPRIPCRKMAVRLAAGQDFPGRYLRSGRVGFFCRVEQPGHLRPGDPIELLNPGAADLTVADLARILHLDDPDPAALTAMLARPDLPEVLRTKAERLLVRATGGDLAWQGERPLVVTARRQEAAEVVSFELADPDGARLPDYAAGQFLTLSMAAGAGKPLVRTYTLAGRGSDGAYRIAVKRDGRASEHLHDQVAEGSRLNARPPRGRFVVEPGDRPVVLVSAGIGITPMVAMLEELAGSEREVHFAHGARSSRELAFGPHVRRITGSRPGLHRHLLFSRPLPGDTDFDGTGRLTAEVLERVLPSLEADFYVCGPEGFMADVVGGLAERGVPEERLHWEFFGTARSLFGGEEGEEDEGQEAVGADGRPIMVTFARSGISVPWRENTFSLLALAERAGLRPEASCRTGLCSTCVCRLDDGEVEYVVEPVDEVRADNVMICCARPRTSVMLDV